MVAAKKNYSVDEYFAWEATHDERFEYLYGDIFAMAGASRPHGLINGNIFALLRPQIRKNSCEMFANDMRVKVSNLDYTYPDVVVACGNPQYSRTPLDTLLNPTLIIEIMSPSTENYDRSAKFKRYRQIESLQEYILIPQHEMLIEQHVRQANNSWLMTEWRGADTLVAFPSIDCQVRVGDVFEQVEFEDETPSE